MCDANTAHALHFFDTPTEKGTEEMTGDETYANIVRRWTHERETLCYVQPCTARKAMQKALLFERVIGDIPVRDIPPSAIADALVELGEQGGIKKEGLSSATLRAAHLAATQAVDWAIKRGLQCPNPFRDVDRPKARYRRSRFLTQEQAKCLMRKAVEAVQAGKRGTGVRETSFALAVCLGLATGMRRGEIFALVWSDFDDASQRISVNKAIKQGGEIGAPKSAASIRSVAIGRKLAELLVRVRRRRNDLNSSVICDEGGKRASMNAFGHWWRRWADENGFEGLRFHELRHTHATLLISSGVDVKTVQTRLGHSSAEITMSCYAHAIPLADGPAAQALDAQLFW